METDLVVQAISEVWHRAHEEESEWGMPMKSALYQVAQILGLESEYTFIEREALGL